MVKLTADEETLGIWSRQFGHLPEPGWRPSDMPTPLEAWEGLLLEDDYFPAWAYLRELLYRVGQCAVGTPFEAPCRVCANARRCTLHGLGGIAVCCCGACIPRACRRRRRVSAAVLPHQGIVGSLPRKPGRGLAGLTRLVLFDNALHGPLPASLGRYRALQALNLSSNRLTGGLPAALRHLRSLRILDLHGNALAGPLGEQCAKAKLHSLRRLTHVSLAENQFEGPFPGELLRMPWLVEVWACSPAGD